MFICALKGIPGVFAATPKPILKAAAKDQHGTFALFFRHLVLQLRLLEHTLAQKFYAAKQKMPAEGQKRATRDGLSKGGIPRPAPGEMARTLCAAQTLEKA